MEENKIENKKTTEQLSQKVEEQLKKVVDQGITSSNIDYAYKLVDIHKDLANEKYWEKKGEMIEMRYNEGYNEGYGRRGVPGTGRYRGDYGRRGVPGSGRGRYRGEDAMMEMQESYEEYNEAYSEAMNGNYGAEGSMVQSAEAIMKNIFEIAKELSEADVPEVQHIIKKYAKKLSDM